MKTDTQLKQDIEAEFAWEPSLNERDIVVSAKDGVVTLAGHVPSYAERLTAEQAAKSIGGVKAIANEIEVKPGTGAQRSDREIADAVVAAFASSVTVPAADIKVVVRDGHVFLDGQVVFGFQRSAAETAVRNLWGIKGITNGILIRPRVMAGDIRGRIHQVYKRHADLDADKINVDVLDSTVTLTGEVHSWHERDDAEAAAWAAPGVTRVKNNLSVSL